MLGYTVIKDIITGLYYNSYSLMPYHTVWNSKAFLFTTGVPLIIMFLINYITLIMIMQNQPSNFLRNEIFKTKEAALAAIEAEKESLIADGKRTLRKTSSRMDLA